MGAATDAQLLARIVRNPGRLVLAPTTSSGGFISGTFPYGGTPLGFVREMRLEIEVDEREQRDPASRAVAEVYRMSVEVYRLYCVIEGPAWDEDLLAAAFSKSTASSSLAGNSPPERRIEATQVPSVVPAMGKILFVADDTKGKSVLFRRPVPEIPLGAAAAFSKARKAGLPYRFVATPDSAYKTTPHAQIARLENITL